MVAKKRTARRKPKARKRVVSSRRFKVNRSQSKILGGLKSVIRFVLLLVVLLGILVGIIIIGCFLFLKPQNYVKRVLFVSPIKEGQEGQVMLAEVNSQTAELNLVKFDSLLERELVGEYGTYKLGSIHSLLSLEKKESVFERFIFSHVLQLGVEEVLVLDKGFDGGELDSKLELVKVLLPNIKTFRLGLVVKDIPEEGFEYQEISSWEEWERYLSLNSSWEGGEECSVAVVNNTQVSGLAGSFSQVIENSGQEVVRVTNNLDSVKETRLLLDPSKYCATSIGILRSVLPFEIKVETDSIQNSQYRASAVLLIGEEVGEWF